MKRMSRKQWWVMVFAGLLAVSGVALAELGPPGDKGEHGQEKGEPIRDRSGECKDMLGVTSASEGTGTHDRARDGSNCGGEPGPNQNPSPGYGEGHSGNK